MGRLTLRLPNELHQQLENLARAEGVSLNQYLVYALTRQATLAAAPADPSTVRERGKPGEPGSIPAEGLGPPSGK